MKQFILFLLYLLIPMRVFSNNQDSIKVVQLQNDIMQIQMRIDSLEKMNQRNILYIDSLNMNINILQDSLLATNIGIKIFQKHLVEFIEDMRRTSQENILHMKSLETYMSVLQDSVMTVNMKMLKGDKYLKQYIEDEKQTTDKELDILFLNVQDRTKYIGIVIVILFIGLSTLFFFGRKNIQKNVIFIDRIEEVQKQMQEESIKLDDKLISLLDRQLSMQQSTSNTETADHSLALKVADEIVRIEMNLSRMDPSIKGYKQLAKAVERIKNNFLANGYEIVDMLGKNYNEGMKVVANFVSDENLKQGEQIITGIIKPQINYNGQMIQAAQITVSQNI